MAEISLPCRFGRTEFGRWIMDEGVGSDLMLIKSQALDLDLTTPVAY
jgi:hypothetical protein